MNIEEFRHFPIMGILRDIGKDVIAPLVETVISSGLKTIEITMNTPQADSLIREMVNAANGKLVIGAGTVLNIEQLYKALDSGASFIVSPVLVEDVVKHCVKNNIPVFPGALTPQEIYNAYESGATMVKVFPSKFFGPNTLKKLKGHLQT